MSRAVQLVLLSAVILTCLQTGVAQDEIAADDDGMSYSLYYAHKI